MDLHYNEKYPWIDKLRNEELKKTLYLNDEKNILAKKYVSERTHQIDIRRSYLSSYKKSNETNYNKRNLDFKRLFFNIEKYNVTEITSYNYKGS